MHLSNVSILLFISLHLTISKKVTVTFDEERNVIYFNNSTYLLSDSNSSVPLLDIIVYSTITLFLCLFCWLISSISISYLSNDDLVLELRATSGTEEEKKCTERIKPILEKRHWLVSTLLVINAFCLVYLPLFIEKIVTRKIAMLASVVLILVFNDVLPHVVINIYNQLIFAERFLDLTHYLMVITSPITFPLGKILDKVIGEKHRFRLLNSDIKALIEMHKINHLKELADETPITKLSISRKHSYNDSVSNNNRNSSSCDSFELNNVNLNSSSNNNKMGLNDEEANLMISALEIREKQVIELMIPIKSTFMIDYDEKLDRSKLKQIVDKGYSRIPVYANHNIQDILGLVRIKQLILVDINENKSLRELGIRLKAPLVIHPSLNLIDLLREFRKGKSHMAFITEQVDRLQKKFGLSRTNSISNNLIIFNKTKEIKILGIITLEDVIEHMFNLEIYDEDDYEKMKYLNSNNGSNGLLAGSINTSGYLSKKKTIRNNNLESIEENSKVNESIYVNNDSCYKKKSARDDFLLCADSYMESLSKRYNEQLII